MMTANSATDLIGTITNVQRMSVHDGPGIRTTVFLKGCPLRCGWCHNPETQSQSVELAYRANRCAGCGQCVKHCPSGALTLKNGKIEKDPDRCIKCLRCSMGCPTFAWVPYGRQVRMSELCGELLKDRAYYQRTGGGVTFSGGEPLLQAKFVIASEKQLKSVGVHTAVETACFGDPELLRQMAEQTDLFMADLKVMDDALHRKWVGAPIAPILSNLTLLSEINADVLIRIPVVCGVNDTVSNMQQTAKFLIDKTHYRKVELLKMHKLGASKYEFLNRNCPAMDLDVPTEDAILRLAEVLIGCGIAVWYRGNKL